MRKVFLDSSVLFTAVNSPTGGSSKLFTLDNIKLYTSLVVLTEVERNVKKKLQSYHLDRFFILTSKLEIINQKPKEFLINQAKKVIHEKDAVILAEASQAEIDVLATLDMKHFFTEKAMKFIFPKKIMTPKMIIEMVEK